MSGVRADRTKACSSSDDDGTIDLVGGYSPTSGRYHFPLLDTCPYTGATDIERVALSRAGTLWAWTAVTARAARLRRPGAVRLRRRGARREERCASSPD